METAIAHIDTVKMSIKRDIQFDVFCPTCRRTTKQALVENSEFLCSVCCEVHDITLPPTSETLKVLMELMSEQQKIDRRIKELSR